MRASGAGLSCEGEAMLDWRQLADLRVRMCALRHGYIQRVLAWRGQGGGAEVRVRLRFDASVLGLGLGLGLGLAPGSDARIRARDSG